MSVKTPHRTRCLVFNLTQNAVGNPDCQTDAPFRLTIGSGPQGSVSVAGPSTQPRPLTNCRPGGVAPQMADPLRIYRNAQARQYLRRRNRGDQAAGQPELGP